MGKIKLRIALIVALCFAVGLIARALWEREPPREEAYIDSFKRHCLPMASGADFSPPEGLQQFRGPPGEDIWIDSGSGLQITSSERGGLNRCSVSDAPKRLTEAERSAVTEALRQLVETEFETFSLLSEETGPDWPFSIIWTGSLGDHPEESALMLQSNSFVENDPGDLLLSLSIAN